MKLLALTIGVFWLGLAAFATAKPLGNGSVVACLEGSYLDTASSTCVNGLAEEPENKKFLIVEFFSLYCGACSANIAQIDKINQRVQGNTSIRYVSLGSESNAKKFVGKYNLKFPVVMDQDELIQNTYRVIEAPQLYVIDRNNEIIYSHIGLITNPDIEEIVNLTK